MDSPRTFTRSDDTLGVKFALSENTSQVLVRVISIPIRFRITHKSKNFLVMAAFWSLESDFDFKFWTINPIDGSIVNEGDFHSSELTFTNALDALDQSGT